MTEPICICPYHPALPGIPSDERVDVPNCPKHHPENIVAKRIRFNADVVGGFTDDSPAEDYIDDVKGLTSAKLAKLVENDPHWWLDHAPVIWSVECQVDDQEPVTVEVELEIG